MGTTLSNQASLLVADTSTKNNAKQALHRSRILLDRFELNYIYTFLPVQQIVSHFRVSKLFFSKLNSLEMWHELLLRDNTTGVVQNLQQAHTFSPHCH